jgi:hypothetical protein
VHVYVIAPLFFVLPQMFGGILLDGVDGIPVEARGNLGTFVHFMKSNQHVVAIQVCYGSRIHACTAVSACAESIGSRHIASCVSYLERCSEIQRLSIASIVWWI